MSWSVGISVVQLQGLILANLAIGHNTQFQNPVEEARILDRSEKSEEFSQLFPIYTKQYGFAYVWQRFKPGKDCDISLKLSTCDTPAYSSETRIHSRSRFCGFFSTLWRSPFRNPFRLSLVCTASIWIQLFLIP
jgi:hypothetical protein